MSENAQSEALSTSKRMLIALKEASARLDEEKRKNTEPIAIIGMGCRFPGQANNPDLFWRNLREGVDAVSAIPPERWAVDSFYDPDPKVPGKIYTTQGGFLADVDRFDPQFFGISPREALSLDPQQRLLLEVTWEALENGGLAPERLEGSPTGVFIGIGQNDYASYHLNSGNPTLIDSYAGTGVSFCCAAGRLSHFLGLQGPNLAIDTACSSSLVAVHLACQSLRSGESDLALAGGVQLILSPQITVFLSRIQALSPDGRCKTFDAGADGYGRGEGCGVVVLKRLSDALRAEDAVLAVIRGSAVNHDGHSSGLTVPNGRAQELLIRRALKNAGVKAEQVNYIEAHGTGTSLGDPIEVGALGRVLCAERSEHEPLLVGSVKTNIGHLEAAAGIAGLIKVVLSLQHGQIPPHLHFRKPSPHIPWQELPITVPTELTSWPAGERLRVAGISSFGFSGTNAHLILEEAPQPAKAGNPATPAGIPGSGPEHSWRLLTLSAKKDESLGQLAQRYEAFLLENPASPLAEICHTTQTGRSHFPHRLAIVARTSADLRQKLAAFSTGTGAHDAREEGKICHGYSSSQPKPVFLFTGQGAEYEGMGRQLYGSQPLFRSCMDRCAELFRPYLASNLLDILYQDRAAMAGPGLADPVHAHPALFALEYSLARLWLFWGVKPAVVAGHSTGEYVAACVAGVFSLEDGVKLIAERARLLQALPSGQGGLVAVFADEKVVNATAAFSRVAGQVSYSPPRITMVSTVTGEPVTEQIAAARYWVEQLCQPVRFADSMKWLLSHGHEVFLEVGPQPALLGLSRQVFADLSPEVPLSPSWLPSLDQGQDDWRSMLDSLAHLYVKGQPVDWDVFSQNSGARRCHVPTYPFQRQSYWPVLPPRANQFSPKTQTRQDAASHPFAMKVTKSPLLQEILCESIFSSGSFAFLLDHRIYDKVVVPGACHISLLLEAIAQLFEKEDCRLQEVLFQQALVIPQDEARIVQLVLTPKEEGWFAFTIISFRSHDGVEGTMIVHASGTLRGQLPSPRENDVPKMHDLREIKARCQTRMDRDEFYDSLANRKIQLGPSFRWIHNIRLGANEALCKMAVPRATSGESKSFQLHPGLIDSCFQLLMTTFPAGTEDTIVPFGIEKFCYHAHPSSAALWCHASWYAKDEDAKPLGHVRLFDEEGRIVAEVTGLECRKANPQTLLHSLQSDQDNWIYEIDWLPKEKDPVFLSPGHAEAGCWLIFADARYGRKLVENLKELGQRTIAVFRGQAYQKETANRFHINPEAPEDFRRLLLEINKDVHSGCQRIIHFWGIDATDHLEGVSLAALQQSIQLSCGSLLHLVQALAGVAWPHLPRLCLVTRGATAAGNGESPLLLPQTPLWGLARVVALEHPELHCTMMDLDPAGGDEDVLDLLGDFWDSDGEQQLAWRKGVRHAARFARTIVPASFSGRPDLDEDGTYLITGGLGALGLEVAKWLVRNGARHLVLTGRSGATSPEATRAIAEIEKNGGRAVVIKADVADPDDVKALLRTIKASMPPLRGLVHAAGVLDEGVLLQQSWERFVGVMAPKVNGAWNLHTLTSSLPLHFFVCFSSIASVMGSPGQGSYAAGNGFMDGLAHYRNSLGLPGLTINWGSWADGGMAARAPEQWKKRVAGFGINPMDTETALQKFGMALGGQSAQVSIVPVDWGKFIRQMPKAVENFYQGLLPSVPNKPSEQDSGFFQKLQAAAADDRRGLLADHVGHTLIKVLGLASLAQVEPHQRVFDLGLDSLMAIEMRTKLESSLGRSIPPSLILNDPTVAELVDKLAGEVLAL